MRLRTAFKLFSQTIILLISFRCNAASQHLSRKYCHLLWQAHMSVADNIEHDKYGKLGFPLFLWCLILSVFSCFRHLVLCDPFLQFRMSGLTGCTRLGFGSPQFFDSARLGVKRVRDNPCDARHLRALGTVWERKPPSYQLHVHLFCVVHLFYVAKMRTCSSCRTRNHAKTHKYIANTCTSTGSKQRKCKPSRKSYTSQTPILEAGPNHVQYLQRAREKAIATPEGWGILLHVSGNYTVVAGRIITLGCS